MPIRLNNRDVVPPGVAAVKLGAVDILSKPPKPVPVAWVAHTSAFFPSYGVLHFSGGIEHDGGSYVSRYKLTAEGETAAIEGVGLGNNRLPPAVRRLGVGYRAIFPFTASTATYTAVAVNALGESEPSDSFTLEGLSGGTAVQTASDISIYRVIVPLE